MQSYIVIHCKNGIVSVAVQGMDVIGTDHWWKVLYGLSNHVISDDLE